ncbi:MAG TPA: hypothetical protein VF796_02835, partial [Humisphaera sp.]
VRPAWRTAAAVTALAAAGGLAAILLPSPRGAWVSVTPPAPAVVSPATQAAASVEQAASLADWRSPTEFLLELAAEETTPIGAGQSRGPFPSGPSF